MGSTFGSYKAIDSDFDFDHGFSDEKELELADYAKNRILRAYWFGLKIGIGVLAF